MNEHELPVAKYLLAEIAAGRIGATAYESFMSGVRHRKEAEHRHLESLDLERTIFPLKAVGFHTGNPEQ